MFDTMIRVYDRLVLGRPLLSIMLVAALVAGFATQLPKITLDASADSLMLQGDPSLELFREVGREYSAEEFVLITWKPRGDLLAPESLLPLRQMADELRELPGVSSVVTVWDVPLLESPPLSLSDITSAEPLPDLSQPGIDLDLVLQELTTSPIYADLLASRDGALTAVQINLERDETYNDLLQQREALRKLERDGTLDAAQAVELSRVEKAFKAHTAKTLDSQSKLVAQVREISDRYRDSAELFVGGVPMIAADMVSFVQSDLVVFGSAILGIMLVVLAVIFRSLPWVMIPLITCSASVVVMLGLLGALDWRMTVISSNFVSVLLIISLALCIHLIVRYRELHAENPEGALHKRVLDTVRLMIVPCFYTAITTMVAFVSLVVSGIQPVIDFGWMMTIGIVVALVLSFVLVPCLMLVWGDKGRVAKPRPDNIPLSVYFARVADRFGVTILVVSVALVALTALGISRLEVENRFIDYFHEDTEIYQGMELLDAQLGGTIPLDIIITASENEEPLPGLEGLEDFEPSDDPIAKDDPFLEDDDFGAGDEAFSATPADDWDDEFGGGFDEFASPEESFQPSYWFSMQGMRKLDAVHQHVDSLEETGKVLSLSTVFEVVKDLMGEDISGVELALVQKSLSGDIAQMMIDPYFSADKEQARLSVRVKETSETLRRNEFLVELRRSLVEDVGIKEENLQLTGMLVLYNNVLQSLFRSQILTLGVVFLAILAMFLILFRSLPLALIALAPNMLAAGIVLGVMGLAGIPLDIMNITITAIVLGIGVDDCIHYVHRFMREFPKDRNYLAAMYRCHASIGRALYYTTITVVIGFCMLMWSNFTPSIYFGLLTVLAMAAAVVGALLLMPRLIILFRPLGPEAAEPPAGSALAQ
ncbi:MAG: MMPL family transporter [Gammaproteobacteria bacterium]|nr:MMPL family transporter [Gammaproteobacteria bacterium]